jgi:hypothetical protein
MEKVLLGWCLLLLLLCFVPLRLAGGEGVLTSV